MIQIKPCCPKTVIIKHFKNGKDVMLSYKTLKKAIQTEYKPYVDKKSMKTREDLYKIGFIIREYTQEEILEACNRYQIWPFQMGFVENVV